MTRGHTQLSKLQAHTGRVTPAGAFHPRGHTPCEEGVLIPNRAPQVTPRLPMLSGNWAASVLCLEPSRCLTPAGYTPHW